MFRDFSLIVMAGAAGLSVQACAQTGAMAPGEDAEWLYQRHAPAFAAAVDIEVSDNVEGGCWTAAGAARQRAGSVFADYSIPVEATDVATLQHPEVHIEAVGYRNAAGQCVGSLRYHVNYNILSDFSLPREQVNFVHFAESFSRLVVADDAGDLNAAFGRFIAASSREFAESIYEARQSPALDGVFAE